MKVLVFQGVSVLSHFVTGLPGVLSSEVLRLSTPLCSLPPGPKTRGVCVTEPGLAPPGGAQGRPQNGLNLAPVLGAVSGSIWARPGAPRRAQNGAQEGPKTASERGFRRKPFLDPFWALFDSPQNPQNRAPA